MRNFSAISAFIALSAFAAACGGEDPPALVDAPAGKEDAAPKQDAAVDAAPQFDFSCMGNSAPADGTAVDPLDIAGTATDFNALTQTLVPVADALVNSFDTGGVAPTATDTTDNAGTFTLAIDSSTDPVDGFVEASKVNFRTIRLYPPSPLIASLTDVPLILMSNTTFNTVVQFAQVSQQATNGTVGLIVADCANTPIDGATPSVKDQDGADVGTLVDGSLVQPGLFFFFDVPPGVVTVGATFSGMTLRAHDIDVVAQVTSTTGVRPGF